MPTNHTTHRQQRADLLRRRAQYQRSMSPDIVQRIIPTDAPADDSDWRICLLGENDESLILHLHGDAILGREPDTDPRSIDFSTWRASDLGVSRRHALLRPTSAGLFLIDLDSTNGTFLNSVSVGHGSARPIEDSDMIMLGSLMITILILKAPSEQSIALTS